MKQKITFLYFLKYPQSGSRTFKDFSTGIDNNDASVPRQFQKSCLSDFI